MGGAVRTISPYTGCSIATVNPVSRNTGSNDVKTGWPFMFTSTQPIRAALRVDSHCAAGFFANTSPSSSTNSSSCSALASAELKCSLTSRPMASRSTSNSASDRMASDTQLESPASYTRSSALVP